MITPTNETIQQSLSKLEGQLNLHRSDIHNITWAFTFQPDKNHFLLTVNAANKKLAETLLIFQRKLKEASANSPALATLIDQVFLHYLVNTTGQIPEEEGADPFDVFDAATRYAATLSVGVGKDVDGTSLLQLDGREIPCPAWNAVPGWSAAWSLREVGPVINRVRYGRDDVIPSSSFEFKEDLTTYSLENAMILADCAHLAYLTPNYVAQQLEGWGYQSFHWIADKDTDTQAFVVEKENHLVVCFRGTSSGRDAIMDLKFLRTEAFGGVGSVHRGFKKALDSVWNQLKEIVGTFDSSKRLFVCGHSLGAALAQLAAYRLAKNGSQIAGVYVYGSPRIGNRSFREAYNQLLQEQTFLHINNKDIVTQSPAIL